jgi:hypothetical protein
LWEKWNLVIKPTSLLEKKKDKTLKMLGLFAAGKTPTRVKVFSTGDKVALMVGEQLQSDSDTLFAFYPETKESFRYGVSDSWSENDSSDSDDNSERPARSNYHLKCSDEYQCRALHFDSAAVRGAAAFINTLRVKNTVTICESVEKIGNFDFVHVDPSGILDRVRNDQCSSDRNRRVTTRTPLFNTSFVEPLEKGGFAEIWAIRDIYSGDELFAQYPFSVNQSCRTTSKEGNLSLYDMWKQQDKSIYFDPSKNT